MQKWLDSNHILGVFKGYGLRDKFGVHEYEEGITHGDSSILSDDNIKEEEGGAEKESLTVE